MKYYEHNERVIQSGWNMGFGTEAINKTNAASRLFKR